MADPFAPHPNDPRSLAFREAHAAHRQRMAESGYTPVRYSQPATPTLNANDEQGVRAAVLADRERMSAILASPEARQAPLLASELAFNSDQSAQSAIDILKAAVAPLQRQTTCPSVPAAASADEIAAGWDAAIDHHNEQQARYDSRFRAPEGGKSAASAPDTADAIGEGWDEVLAERDARSGR